MFENMYDLVLAPAVTEVKKTSSLGLAPNQVIFMGVLHTTGLTQNALIANINAFHAISLVDTYVVAVFIVASVVPTAIILKLTTTGELRTTNLIGPGEIILDNITYTKLV